MSVGANRQRVLNAISGGRRRGLHSLSGRGMTADEVSEVAGLSLTEVRQAVAELWERGLVRSERGDLLVRGRDPAAPCGRDLPDGRPCSRRPGHAPPCRAN